MPRCAVPYSAQCECRTYFTRVRLRHIRAVWRSTVPHGTVRRHAARSVNAPLVLGLSNPRINKPIALLTYNPKNIYDISMTVYKVTDGPPLFSPYCRSILVMANDGKPYDQTTL